MSVGGCSNGGPTVVEVDGRVFRVPQKHLVKGAIPWLSASQSDGLKFIVNPQADLDEQMIVTLESRTKTCSPTSKPSSTQLAATCAGAIEVDKEEGQNLVLQRVHKDGDPTQWEYRSKDHGAIEASCYALSDNKTGLCTSLSRYKDMVYSVGLRDSDVNRLHSIRRKVSSLLRSWEVTGNGG